MQYFLLGFFFLYFVLSLGIFCGIYSCNLKFGWGEGLDSLFFNLFSFLKNNIKSFSQEGGLKEKRNRVANPSLENFYNLEWEESKRKMEVHHLLKVYCIKFELVEKVLLKLK